MNLMVDGRAAYADTGDKPFDPTLPCVVFIHGALHDHSVWTPLARWAAQQGHAVLALDLPGHGRSAGPALSSVEALAQWTLALLDAADVQHAALVGHSMGSLVALDAAGAAPTRIHRLVMLATAAPMKVSDGLLTMARDAPLQAIEMVNALSFSSSATPLENANRALMQRTQSAQQGCNLLERDLEVCRRYAHGLEAAAAVRCPATVMVGDCERMTPPKAARAISSALNATVVALPCGHSMMQELPDDVLTALRDALA